MMRLSLWVATPRSARSASSAFSAVFALDRDSSQRAAWRKECKHEGVLGQQLFLAFSFFVGLLTYFRVKKSGLRFPTNNRAIDSHN